MGSVGSTSTLATGLDASNRDLARMEINLDETELSTALGSGGGAAVAAGGSGNSGGGLSPGAIWVAVSGTALGLIATFRKQIAGIVGGN